MWIALPAVTLAAAVVIWRLSARLDHWRRQASRLQRELAAARQAHEAQVGEARTNQLAAFNSMVEGLLILDVSGRVRFANSSASRMLGAGRDLAGKTVLEATRRHELQDVAARAEADGRVTGFEFQLSAADGGRVLQVNAASLRDPGGEFAGVVLVLHDVSRIKQLEHMRQEFVANVSHELRTPLSLIKGFVETLLDGARNDPAVLER
jgi:two-component system, OmpR family, phosphate regulon sensor histidine kinase PhoR